MKALIRRPITWLLIIIIVSFLNWRVEFLLRREEENVLPLTTNKTATEPTITPSPTPTPAPTLDPTPIPYKQIAQSESNDPWGVAKQISEHTWTIKIGQDERMATPEEIYEALNIYRERNGARRLGWNDRLAAYAQSRADFFNQNGKMDEHAGFREYTSNLENLKSLGFWRVGENSSIGYRLLGVHLIE